MRNLIVTALLAAAVSIASSAVFRHFDPPSRLGVLDMNGLTTEFKESLRDVPDEDFLGQAEIFAKALNGAVEGLKADGWVLFPAGVALGGRDLTPDVAAVLCKKGIFCRTETGRMDGDG